MRSKINLKSTDTRICPFLFDNSVICKNAADKYPEVQFVCNCFNKLKEDENDI